MGNDESLPILDFGQKDLNCSRQNLTTFPFRVPPNHPIESINLSNNLIKVIPPCLHKLQILDYSDNNLQCISPEIEKALLTYKQLRCLNLSRNSIEIIPSSLKLIKTIKVLVLNSNKIRHFDIKFDNLEKLDISCNQLSDFKIYNKAMQYLNLSFNQITKVDFGKNSLLARLQILFIAGNDLVSFPDSFEWPNLTHLDISYNKIQTKLPDFSKIAPKLEMIDFSYNRIEFFPDSLPLTITTIKAKNNLIADIPPLLRYSKLTTLYINENRIRSIPDLPPSLTDFLIDHNEISTDHSNINANLSLPNLSTLLFNNNQMNQLPFCRDCLKSIFLNISYNKLTEISGLANISDSICRLDLSCNSIRSIPPDLFLTLQQIDQLILFQNNIANIPNEVILSHLKVLNVSGNPLSSLPPLPSSLMVLSAQDCSFENFPICNMDELIELKSIDFSNNKISEIPIYKSNNKLFFETLQIILLSCNRISSFPVFCDSIEQIDLSHNLISSVSIVQTFEKLCELDVSYNQLTEFSINQIQPQLEIVKMSHNENLSFQFDSDYFPVLDCLDIGHTDVSINQKARNEVQSKGLRRTIREIIKSRSYSIKPSVKILTDNDSVGYAEKKGLRPTMEDSLIIRKLPSFELYGVIDGHGGAKTSNLVAFKLPQLIAMFDVKSLIDCISNVNHFLFEMKVNDGATLSLMLLKKDEKMFSLNIGDSRVIIVHKDMTVTPLTNDHKPFIRDELEQIRKCGNWISADGRIGGMLAVSRALGDFLLDGVSALPDIGEYIITENDYRAVIACDGVFDVLTNEEVGKIVCSEDLVSVAAYKIRNTAFSHLSDDNISVIVAELHSPSKTE